MVTYDPEVRLAHLENYVENIHMKMPFEEARIMFLRSRLQGYKIISEMDPKKYSKEHVDDMIREGEKKLEERFGKEVKDLFEDPCSSQYILLSEIRSYTFRNRLDPFMVIVRAEFKKIFIPALRLLTELCKSENKYSWEEMKAQLQQYMDELEVGVTWEECDAYMDKYLLKVSRIMDIEMKKD